MRNCVVNFCENQLYVYCYDNKCRLDIIELDASGCCASFMSVDIPKKVITHYKIKHIKKLVSRSKNIE